MHDLSLKVSITIVLYIDLQIEPILYRFTAHLHIDPNRTVQSQEVLKIPLQLGSPLNRPMFRSMIPPTFENSLICRLPIVYSVKDAVEALS